MPLDIGRVTHLLDQMHRSEDDAGDPIDAGFLLAADGARGQEWVDPSTITGSTLTIKDEGSTLTAAATSVDVVGAGATATNIGAAVTLTVPGQTFATPAVVLGTAAAAGAASTGIRSDSTIVAFDATVPVTQALSDTAATGSAAVAARRDHKHGMPASGTSAADTSIWRPVMDGAGAVLTDGATGEAIMAYGAA
jgi:hypothetical protein